MALVQLSVVEQRLDAVRAVLAGARVGEVAASVGVSRQSVHAWMTRYLAGGVAGLADRSHRPRSSPRQSADVVEVAVAEMRRQHPRWGAKRIRLEFLRRPPIGWAVPSTRTINRILARHGLIVQRKRKRTRKRDTETDTEADTETDTELSSSLGGRKNGSHEGAATERWRSK